MTVGGEGGGHDCQGVGMLWASTGTSTRESRLFSGEVDVRGGGHDRQRGQGRLVQVLGHQLVSHDCSGGRSM